MIAAALFLLSAQAKADKVGPLVPRVTPAGALGQEAIDKLHDVIARGLEGGGLSSLEPGVVREQLATAGLTGCGDTFCVGRAADALKVSRIVTTQVQVTGKNYSIVCELFAAAQEAPLVTAIGSCDICTFAEAQTETARVAADLAKRAPPKAPVAAAVPPPAAVVAPISKTPPSHNVAPAAVGPGASESGSSPKPLVVTETALRAHPYVWVAAASWIMGAGAMAAGGYLVSIHGQPSCTSDARNFDPVRDCPEVFDTGVSGAVFMGAGAVAIAAGFLLFFHDDAADDAVGIGIAPSHSGGFASGWLRW